MKDLQFIVSKYFPNEIILKNKKVLLKTSHNLVVGVRVAGVFNSGNLPISMVETDKKYYFDIRPIHSNLGTLLKNFKNTFNLLIFALVVVYGIYIIGSILWHSSLISRIFLMTFIILWSYIMYKYAQTDFNILAIKKEWVTEKSKEGDTVKLIWSLPKGVLGFSILQLLSRDKYAELPLYLKFQSGLWVIELLPFIKNLSPINFKEIIYTYKEV